MSRKSTHTDEYAQMLKLLIEARKAARLNQVDVGKNFAFGQPGISKIERGERRIDVIELRMYCAAIGMTLPEFVRRLEERLGRTEAAG